MMSSSINYNAEYLYVLLYFNARFYWVGDYCYALSRRRHPIQNQRLIGAIR